jgi:hypothetical protein
MRNGRRRTPTEPEANRNAPRKEVRPMHANADHRLRIAQALRAVEIERAERRRLIRARPQRSLRRSIGRSLIRLGEHLAAESPRRRTT